MLESRTEPIAEKKHQTVLLTGARAPVSLEVCRALGSAGHRVLLADSLGLPLTRWSSSINRYFRVAAPANAPRTFVDDIVRISKQQKVDWIIPTCEEIFFLAARRDQLPATTKLFAEPLAKLRPMHDKWQFIQSLPQGDCPIAVPETHRMDSTDELQLWTRHQSTEDWVFKPVYSRFAARTLIGPRSELVAQLKPTVQDPWVAQRLIRGQEYCTCSIAQHGQLRAHACYRSRYRAGPGSGIYFFAEEVPAIEQFVSHFVRTNAFTGIIGFDFIRQADGAVYVIECNPRATSGMHLLPPPGIADALMNPEVTTLHRPMSQQPMMLAAVMPLYAIPQAWRGQGLGQLVLDCLRARDVTFRWGDPLPGLMAPLALLEVICRSWRSGTPLTTAATSDIEWNGEPL